MPLEHVTESRNADALSAKWILGLARLAVAIEPITRIDAGELIRRARCQRTCRISRSIEGIVMMHHHDAVAREMDIELDAIGAER